MGRGDKRNSLKMRQRKAQAKKKARLKKLKEGKKQGAKWSLECLQAILLLRPAKSEGFGLVTLTRIRLAKSFLGAGNSS